MAYTITDFTPEMRRRVDGFFTRVGDGMAAYLDARSRREQIDLLEAKTDEELARMGLTRDRIVAHVFRDVIWV